MESIVPTYKKDDEIAFSKYWRVSLLWSSSKIL
jgi:hypothetical protein